MLFLSRKFIQSVFFLNTKGTIGCNYKSSQKVRIFKCNAFSLSSITTTPENLCSNIMENKINCSSIKKHLDSPEFHSIFSAGLQKLQEIFLKNNYELRICGGAVRDLLLGKKPKDLDFATVATPGEMISMFEKEGIRLINESGWGHGTVTCRIEEENFEITTLRIDTVTDGRRAVVEYTKDWKVDASRRDLTFNSMFLTLNGDIIDYFNGMEDLFNRHVRFVGDPQRRINEDYLRILRFFRFFGRIADSDTEFDEDTTDIISKNLHGLKRVSGERIQMELELIFTGDHVLPITRMMHKCGLFPLIGLPTNANLDEFERIYNSSKHLSPHYMTYLTGLLENENDLIKFRERVKFSNEHMNIACFILRYRSYSLNGPQLLSWYIDILVEYDRQNKQKFQHNYFFEFLKYKGDVQAMKYFTNFKIPRFPVSGSAVKEKTGLKGKLVGVVINYLVKLWKESRYTLTESELLNKLDEETVAKLNESLA